VCLEAEEAETRSIDRRSSLTPGRQILRREVQQPLLPTEVRPSGLTWMLGLPTRQQMAKISSVAKLTPRAASIACLMEFLSGPPGFQPLDPTRPIKRSRRHLPHWTQDGATYFVTFHLGDSLPQERLQELRTIYKQFATQKFSSDEEQDERRREILRRVESWLDAGHGSCWLSRKDVAAMMSNSLLHFHGKRYELGAHCVMPNHVHAVLRPFDGHSLDDVLHSWKVIPRIK
jgi:hypothetical protein